MDYGSIYKENHNPVVNNPGLMMKRCFTNLTSTPVCAVLLFFICYLMVAGTYIALSTSWAAEQALSVEDLRRLEIIKGLLYVAISGILFSALVYLLLAGLGARTAEAEEARKDLVISEGKSLAKTMVASLAHDANNMLGSVQAGCDLLPRQGTLNAEQQRSLAHIHKGVQRMRAINQRLMCAAHGDEQPLIEAINLVAEVDRCLEWLGRDSRCQHCRIEQVHPLPDLRVDCDRGLLDQALSNLLLNAAAAVGGRGKVRVTTGRDNGQIILEVHDDGPGIVPELRERVFEPFFTSKANGFGLGLLSVLALVRHSNGQVQVDDSPLGGACFRLRLPAAG
jgi:signal transduction histidine kinase